MSENFKTNKLNPNEEQILIFLRTKYEFNEDVESILSDIASDSGISKSTTKNYIKHLIQLKYVLSKNKGNYYVYAITRLGRDYLDYYQLESNSTVPHVPIEDEESIIIQNKLNEIKDIRDQVEIIKDEIENMKSDLKETIKQNNKRIENFYGRIGEILALVITAIAMIVFNIQLIGSVKIDFNNPVNAFRTIMSIDLPYIILFLIFVTIFHFIIEKDYNKDKIILKDIIPNIIFRILPFCILILLCFLILIA